MPRNKYLIFSGVLAGFLLILSFTVVMTYPRYQKSMEQLPELIADDTSSTNPALLQIKEQLEVAGNSEKDDLLKVVWTGSVCASKYQTLSGSERIYYVCPYVIANTASLTGDAPSDWTLSLQFAVSVLRDGELAEIDSNIQVEEILFSCRVGENAVIVSAGYGDGEMNEVNGKSVSYQFRDRDHIGMDTNVFARLSLGSAIEDKQKKIKEETAVVNWSFQIQERNHVIGIFDDVQIEIPYLFSM